MRCDGSDDVEAFFDARRENFDTQVPHVERRVRLDENLLIGLHDLLNLNGESGRRSERRISRAQLETLPQY